MVGLELMTIAAAVTDNAYMIWVFSNGDRLLRWHEKLGNGHAVVV